VFLKSDLAQLYLKYWKRLNVDIFSSACGEASAEPRVTNGVDRGREGPSAVSSY
jgi:hypothetical protein